MLSTKLIEGIVAINWLTMDTKKNNQCASHDRNQYTLKQWWNLITKNTQNK